jgi:hypothetical protein
MIKYKTPLILQCLLVFIPLNFYMWGNWMLVDLQWAFFRFQNTTMGSGFIFFHRDVDFILLGYTTGIHNILSVILWTAGSILLLFGILFTIAASLQGEVSHVRTASYLTFGAGILYLISAVERFMAGFAIPVGLPVLFLIAYLCYRQEPETDEDSSDIDDSDDDSDDEEDGVCT